MENTYYNKGLLDEDANLHLERLADQTGELEKRIKQLEISPQDSSSVNTLQTNVDSLQSSVNTNTNSISTLQGIVNTHTSSINNLTSTVNSFQSAINQNTQNITTNTNGITNLTTSVNSCLQAVSDINNGAELPTPLFTIAGHSFGTPVYSVYDEYDCEIYRLYNSLTKTPPIFFIADAYSPWELKIKINYEAPDSIVQSVLVVLIDDIEVKRIVLDYTASTVNTIETSIKMTNNIGYHKINSYIQTTATPYHLNSHYELHGKNVQFTSSKRNIYILQDLENKYIVTKTINKQPYFQEDTFENLDFENGLTLFPEFADNQVNSQYAVTYTYFIDANGNYARESHALHFTYNNRLGFGYVYYGNNWTPPRKFSTDSNVYDYNRVFLENYDDLLHCGAFVYNNNNVKYAYTSKRLAATYSYNNLPYGLSHTNTQTYFADIKIITDPYLCQTHRKRPIVLINQNGECFLTQQESTLYFVLKVAFGTQPCAYYANSTSNDIVILLNCFGTIKKFYMTYNPANYTYSKTSEEIFCYADYVIKGHNNDCFVCSNNLIKKDTII